MDHITGLAKVSKAPSLAQGSFYPRGINITFIHPKHGEITASFEDSEGDDTVVHHWHTKAVSLWCFNEGTVKTMIRNIGINAKVLKVETNHKPWGNLINY